MVKVGVADGALVDTDTGSGVTLAVEVGGGGKVSVGRICGLKLAACSVDGMQPAHSMHKIAENITHK